MLTGQFMDQGDLGLGHIPGVDPGDANPFLVDIQHDFGGILGLFVKDGLQNHDHKVHGGVVIIVKEYLEQGRLLDLAPVIGGNPALELVIS
jgi:hypothetical protein